MPSKNVQQPDGRRLSRKRERKVPPVCTGRELFTPYFTQLGGVPLSTARTAITGDVFWCDAATSSVHSTSMAAT